VVPLTDPWAVPWGAPSAPPRAPHPRRTRIVVLAVAIGALLATGVGTVVTHAVRDQIRADQALDREAKAADEAFDRRLREPADTATVSPGPGGSKAFAVPAPNGSRHAYELRLPPGWEGRRLGFRESPYNYADAVLNAPALGAAITIDRIEIGVRTGSPEMEAAFREAMGGAPDHVTFAGSTFVMAVGQGERAYGLDGTLDDEGEPGRLRIVVFDHGNVDTFRVDVFAPAARWGTVAPQVDRILASWRWG
jgi:hypothetical protein